MTNRNDDPDSDSADVERVPRPDALGSSVDLRVIELTNTGDWLASFSSEPGADPLPGEALAEAASQQDSATGVSPIPPRAAPSAARLLLARAAIAARRLTHVPIPRPILWPLLLAVAVFIGVALGSTYARYLRPNPVSIAGPGPAVTERGRVSSSTDTSAAPEPVQRTGATIGTSALGPPAPPPSNVSPPKSNPARPQLNMVHATRPRRAETATIPAGLETAAGRFSAAALPSSTVAELPTVPSPAPAAPPGKTTAIESERLAVDDERTIRTILDAYRVAYERLDVVAASTLWPGVDTRALTRAFGTLASQRMAFERCDIAVTGAHARARCDGAITYTRRVGVAQPQSRPMSWTFALDRSSGQWRISNVHAR